MARRSGVQGDDGRAWWERAEDAERGDKLAMREVAESVGRLCRRPTKWQYVIHGETNEYRALVAEVLMDGGRFGGAVKFGTCGCADRGMMKSDGSEAKVRAMGCGMRFCPRCSKRYGWRS